MSTSPRTLSWQTLDLSDRERQYNPSSCLPDGNYQPFVQKYRSASEAAWSEVQASTKTSTALLRYGQADSQTIDVAVPSQRRADVPILVYLHGGYWQELSKVDSRFSASGCISRGWAFAGVDYTLAPDATLDEIVAECRQAVRTLKSHSAELGFDSAGVFVAGSSAGAHLAAMVALTEDLAGTVLVSGVFDLEPLVGLSINEALGLDQSAARANSPLVHSVDGFPPTVVAYGSNETSEFKAQTDSFARHLAAAGVHTHSLEVEDRNHFDVVLDLAEQGTELGDSVAKLIAEVTETGGSDAGL